MTLALAQIAPDWTELQRAAIAAVCDALFEASAVTSTLYCEACLTNWN